MTDLTSHMHINYCIIAVPMYCMWDQLMLQQYCISDGSYLNARVPILCLHAQVQQRWDKVCPPHGLTGEHALCGGRSEGVHHDTSTVCQIDWSRVGLPRILQCWCGASEHDGLPWNGWCAVVQDCAAAGRLLLPAFQMGASSELLYRATLMYTSYLMYMYCACKHHLYNWLHHAFYIIYTHIQYIHTALATSMQ